MSQSDGGRSSTVDDKLAAAVTDLATAVRRNTELLEVLWEGLAPRKRAQLLGVSPRTERHRRQRREAERLLSGAGGRR